MLGLDVPARCAKHPCFSRTSTCREGMLATAKTRERDSRSAADTCASGEGGGASLQGTLLFVGVTQNWDER